MDTLLEPVVVPVNTSVRDNVLHLSLTYNDGEVVPLVQHHTGGAPHGRYAHLTRTGIMINAEFLRLPGTIFRGLAANIVEDFHYNRAINDTLVAPPVALRRVVPATVGERDRWRKADLRSARVPERCMICMEDFKSNQKIRRIHDHANCVFHEKCIERWFVEKPRCPGCNVDVESYEESA